MTGGAATPERRRLVINADDFGYSAGVTRGIVEAHAAGSVTSTSMMANGIDWENAVRLARSTRTLDVGVHLNLVQGRPLLRVLSLTSVSDRTRRSGRPCTRLRCTPTSSVRVERARRTAFSQSIPFAIIEVDVTLPAACASTMPRVTPAEYPKSSALMTSRRRSGVAAPPVIDANANEVAHHPEHILGETHRGRLLVVAEEHSRLREREPVLPRDEQRLDVEPEAGDRDARKDDLRRAPREALEPRLRVEHARDQRPAYHRVEHTAHHVPRVQIRKEGGAHAVSYTHLR